MNNRRSFFKSLIGLFVAPKLARALPAEAPIPAIAVYASARRLKANWSIVVEQDLMSMHNIDLEAMILTNVSKAIQDEVDNNKKWGVSIEAVHWLDTPEKKERYLHSPP